MKSLDWTRPVVDCSGDAWEVLTDLGGDDEFPVVCECECGDIQRFSIDGTCKNNGYIRLQNPQSEPKRAPGWYWVKSLTNGRWSCAFHKQLNQCSDRHSVVGPRIYAPDEYRPADKCPPPMDETPFEVEAYPDRTFRWLAAEGKYVSRKSLVDIAVYLTPSYASEHRLRWRPIQGSQS